MAWTARSPSSWGVSRSWCYRPWPFGLALRGLAPRLQEAQGELAGLAALTLVVLVYAAMGGAGEGGRLLSAALAGTLFLVVSTAC